MRIHRMRFDIWLCLLLAYLVGTGASKLTALAVASTYDSYVEAHTVAAGEIGGVAGDDVFRAQSVEDLLRHDTFTVVSPGIEYRNRGAGYYGNWYMQALTLPSGELVAAVYNLDSVQIEGSYYTGEATLPVGRVVFEDLTENETFLHQIAFKEPLSRRDFYVDMMGTGGKVSQEDYGKPIVLSVQLVVTILFFPIFHALGATIGIFPYFFPPKNKKESEWD
mgnify:FL=1